MRAEQRRWDDDRRAAYSQYLGAVSLARQVFRSIAEDDERDHRIDEAVSKFNGLRVGYNEIRIVSSSSDVDENARQMLIAAEEVLKSLRQGEGRASSNWRSADHMYERHRALFLDAVQRELGISRR